MNKHTFICPKCNSTDTMAIDFQIGKIYCMACHETYVCAYCVDKLEQILAPHEEQFRKSKYYRSQSD